MNNSTNLLQEYQTECPDWLKELNPADINKNNLKDNLRNILKNSLVYPGAGTDISHINETLGIVYSYLFFDYFITHYDHTYKEVFQTDMLNILKEKYTMIGTCELWFSDLVSSEKEKNNKFYPPDFRDISPCFDKHPEMIFDGRMESEWSFLFRLRNGISTDGNGYIIWAIFSDKKQPQKRFNVLLINREAIQTIAELYKPFGISPRILVLQEHGKGGNCWISFAKAYYQIIRKDYIEWPEILIEEDYRAKLKDEKRYQEYLKEDHFLLSERGCYEKELRKPQKAEYSDWGNTRKMLVQDKNKPIDDL